MVAANIQPSTEEKATLGPTAVAFLKALSEPHPTGAFDDAMNGAIGGIIGGGALGAALAPVYRAATYNHAGWPAAKLLPGRFAQFGFLFGTASMGGTALCERVRGKQDAANALLSGAWAGAASCRFVSWCNMGGAPVARTAMRTLTLVPARLPGTVLSAMAGAAASTMIWDQGREATATIELHAATTAAATAQARVSSSLEADAPLMSDPWAHGASAITAARGYVAEKRAGGMVAYSPRE